MYSTKMACLSLQKTLKLLATSELPRPVVFTCCGENEVARKNTSCEQNCQHLMTQVTLFGLGGQHFGPFAHHKAVYQMCVVYLLCRESMHGRVWIAPFGRPVLTWIAGSRCVLSGWVCLLLQHQDGFTQQSCVQIGSLFSTEVEA